MTLMLHVPDTLSALAWAFQLWRDEVFTNPSSNKTGMSFYNLEIRLTGGGTGSAPHLKQSNVIELSWRQEKCTPFQERFSPEPQLHSAPASWWLRYSLFDSGTWLPVFIPPLLASYWALGGCFLFTCLVFFLINLCLLLKGFVRIWGVTLCKAYRTVSDWESQRRQERELQRNYFRKSYVCKDILDSKK